MWSQEHQQIKLLRHTLNMTSGVFLALSTLIQFYPAKIIQEEAVTYSNQLLSSVTTSRLNAKVTGLTTGPNPHSEGDNRGIHFKARTWSSLKQTGSALMSSHSPAASSKLPASYQCQPRDAPAQLLNRHCLLFQGKFQIQNVKSLQLSSDEG